MHPDMILTGGILHTIDPNSPRATALVIAGDSIMAVGDTIMNYLPAALEPQCYPFRAMIEAGIIVAFSSDGPVTLSRHS